ncbi:hypothetical protein COCOBI_15-1530 [Coccomyxa sp. Obi]|nr:hypothetical protein COCOBI_15-1530 [Coccomyxa sp. Obi]
MRPSGRVVLGCLLLREGLDLDELLGWHLCPAPDGHAYPILFHAVNQSEAVVHLTEAGYDLGPFLGYCIRAPLYGLSARTGISLPVVWENFSMLMWAAAYGYPAGVKSLLQLGMDPNFQPTPKNAWVPTAVSAALNSSIILLSNTPEIPLGDKLECILDLLRWKAAITVDELRQVLQMMYKAQRSKVAKDLWAFLQKKAAACAECGLIGDWRTCACCKASFYCSRACQHSHWLQHRDTCQQHVGDKVGQAGDADGLQAALKSLAIS